MSLEPSTDATTWRRVSRKYIVVDVVGQTIGAIVLVGLGFIPFAVTHALPWILLPSALAIIGIVLIALTPRRVGAIGYQLREDDLLIRRGLAWKRFVSVPYGRMQLVDINRGPLARLLGLSELKVVTAAASSSIELPGLVAEDAEELRDRLVALAETRRAGL